MSEPIEDPASVLRDVLTTPLVDHFETVQFAVSSPAEADEELVQEELTGLADLTAGKYVWHREGDPILYRNGSTMYERREQYGTQFWVAGDYDPTSLGTAFSLPWPGPIDDLSPYAPASDMPLDPVSDLGPDTVRGEPVRHLVMRGVQTVGGDRLFGDEVTPEQDVEYSLDLFVDSRHRPRGIAYSMWLFGEEFPLSIEFWDLDGDITVEDPADLLDPPPERPQTGPAGATALRVALAGHDSRDPITRSLEPGSPSTTFELRENSLDSSYKPGELNVYVRSAPDNDVARAWEITILPAGERATPGTYPIVSSLLGQDEGTARLRLDDYLCTSDAEAIELVVHEIEYDDHGPSRFRATFQATCPSGGAGQYYPEIEGEISINALSS